jgi:hypothetical protein
MRIGIKGHRLEVREGAGLSGGLCFLAREPPSF